MIILFLFLIIIILSIIFKVVGIKNRIRHNRLEKELDLYLKSKNKSLDNNNINKSNKIDKTDNSNNDDNIINFF